MVLWFPDAAVVAAAVAAVAAVNPAPIPEVSPSSPSRSVFFLPC